MRRVLLVFTLICGVLLAACEPEATPFPVDIPTTPTADANPPTPDRLPRIALAANTTGFVPQRDTLDVNAEIIELDAGTDLNALEGVYDLVTAYGAIPGWTRIEPDETISLVIGDGADGAARDLIQRALNPTAAVASLNISGAELLRDTVPDTATIRTELANLGRPDGLVFLMGHAFIPGADEIAAGLTAANIETLALESGADDLWNALESGAVGLALIRWREEDARTRWAERFGAENVIDLYRLPLSYLAAPGVQISLTAAGWPRIER